MLCQFSVSNFGCIRDTATLDLQATALTEHRESVFVDVDEETFLPLAVIYGPNGAGKSTVLQAIYALVLTVILPVQATTLNYEKSEERINQTGYMPRISPFRFSDKAKTLPTKFEMFFRTSNNEFQYNLHIQKEKVVYERLARKSLEGQRYSQLFERDAQSIELHSYFKDYTVQDMPNHLPLLSYLMITHGKNTILRDVRDWFENRIEMWDFGNPIKEGHINVAEDKAKELIIEMFEEMDIDITDYRVIRDDSGRIKNIYTKHTVQGKDYELELAEESKGTIKLFSILPLIVRALAKGSTLVIDELDAKLHPLLLQYIIELFSNPYINKRKSQLLFTSQDISTMSLDILRRDEIWFVAKSEEQATKLYSLVEFNLARKDAVVGKQYLEGRYGADPYLKRMIDWSKEE